MYTLHHSNFIADRLQIDVGTYIKLSTIWSHNLQNVPVHKPIGSFQKYMLGADAYYSTLCTYASHCCAKLFPHRNDHFLMSTNFSQY